MKVSTYVPEVTVQSVLKTASRAEWGTLTHLEAQTPERAALHPRPSFRTQWDPRQPALSAPGSPGPVSQSVCLLMGRGDAAALAFEYNPVLGPQDEVLLEKDSDCCKELSAVSRPNSRQLGRRLAGLRDHLQGVTCLTRGAGGRRAYPVWGASAVPQSPGTRDEARVDPRSTRSE